MRRGASAGHERDEHEEGQGTPEPAAFDKVDVEDVALLGEVGGCEVLGLEGLFEHVVGAEVVGGAEGG